ncbi:hypothetical protein PENTCL1PPCAC_27970 [Pristionchus entomophagus]|uniref:SET domain-containing protein n=1 Tax=Pristionchus entomophagus TaxID=358040 RepID=A0AAV5UH78_9BILA|nr:hypothetical protein PENTCL1PPCAC_27970 [Pristionchus entomophagus]
MFLSLPLVFSHLFLQSPNFSEFETVTMSPHEKSNLFMFFNTACAPNVIQSIIVDERKDSRWGRFGLHARMDIEPGQELCWDYYCSQEIGSMEEGFRFECACGARNCRYTQGKWAEHDKKMKESEKRKKIRKEIRRDRSYDGQSINSTRVMETSKRTVSNILSSVKALWNSLVRN